MLSPLVSIIIPCFNGGAYVKDAVKSALDQTYANKEVIVVDDGSTDNSLEIIKSFGDRIRWHSGPNRGGGAARNIGIQMSKGEFIQFLDADDVLISKCLEVKVGASIYEQEIVVSDWDTMSENGSVVTCQPPDEQDPVLAQLAGQFSISGPLHRKATMAKIKGFDIGLACCQERDLHLRMACSGIAFRRVPQVLHRIYRRPGSVSFDYIKVLLAHEVVFSRAINILQESGKLSEEREKYFARIFAKEGRYLYHHGEKEAADRYFKIAVELNRAGAMSAYGNQFIRLFALLKGHKSTEKLVAFLRRYEHGKSKVERTRINSS